MKITIETKTLEHTLAAVIPFASRDETRPMICGVLFRVADEQLHVVATDGHTLAEARPCHRISIKPGTVQALISVDDATELRTLLKTVDLAEVTVDIEHDRVAIKNDRDALFVAEAIDKQYPAYETVVPPRMRSGVNDAVSTYALNPEYVERAVVACKRFVGGKVALRNACIGFGAASMRFSNPDEPLGGVRMDFEHASCGSLTMVIMPMRVG